MSANYSENSVAESNEYEISQSTVVVEEKLFSIPVKRSLRKKIKKPEVHSEPIPIFRKGRLDLSLREKLKILEMLDANPKMSQRRVSGTFNVSQSQISRIKNNKAAIMKEWQNGNYERKRKRIGKGGDVLEEQLLKWYYEAKNGCIPLSGPLLMEKAKDIALEQQIKFTPTSGWFGRWKVRHNITLKVIKKAINDSSMSFSKLCHHWRRYTFTKLIKNFNSDSVWFLGHTNLYYNATINNVSEFNDNKLESLDQSLKNINLILSFDINGVQRRAPLIAGVEKISNDNLPVSYYDSTDGRITKEIFSKWLVKWDNELKCRKLNIIIFLQKSYYVPDNLRLNCITLHFYPESNSNESLQIQPLDKGVILLLNSLYRYQIVAENRSNELLKKQIKASPNINGEFISSISHNFSVDISLIDALFMIRRSWEHLNPDILVQGVVRAGLSKDVLACSTDGIISSPPLLTDEEFNALVNIESLAKIKSISKVSEGVCNDATVPNTVEVLMACRILKKFLQNENANQVDKFSEIETNIQDCILKDSESSQISHPFYSTKSVHSFHGHKNTLKKRHSASKLAREDSKQTLDHSNGIIHPSSELGFLANGASSYKCQNIGSCSHPPQRTSGILDCTKYGNDLQQHINSHQSADISTSSPQSQSIMEFKNVPTVVPRVADHNMDNAFAFRANSQHQPRAILGLNPQIVPVSDVNNHTSAFFTFASHF